MANLRYDALTMLLAKLGAKLCNDAVADLGRGRPQLAGHLKKAGVSTFDAAREMRKAWLVCEPFMKT